MPTIAHLQKAACALAVAAVTAAASFQAAHASVTGYASFGFVPFGTVTPTPPGDLSLATTYITLAPTSVLVNTINSTYLGHTTNLALTGGEAVGLSLLTLTTPAVNSVLSVNEVVTVGTYTFTFTSQKVTAKNAGNVALLFNGTFADSSGVFTSGTSADMSVSFTQSSPGSSVNASFSVDTPASQLIPEPASMALLGTGLLGMGLIRRRKHG